MKFAILTMSNKYGGYCVAGIDMNNGCFYRLVLDESGSAIPKYYMYGFHPLDVIDIDVLKYVPETCQTENIIVDWNTKRKIGSITLQDVLRMHPLDTPDYLFVNDNYYLWEEIALSLDYSLLIVQVYDMVIHTEPGENHNQTKADFYYNGNRYCNIAITDWEFYNKDQSINSAIIVLSIPNKRFREDNECYFKFIAKIL